MQEIIDGHLYDYPKYYDLVFGSDWKAECDFLQSCFAKHAKCRVERLFEPACGTGRLLIKLAQAGYAVAGNDLNPRAVKFCNDRLQRHGFAPTAEVGDMSDFQLKRKVDAAFNTINSFRHLSSEKAAVGHLQCMADCLKTGGIYLLGLHLIPTKGEPVSEESWSASRGHLTVNTYMWSKGIDTKKRDEQLGVYFDVYTPLKQFRIVDEMHYRTYTAAQMRRLLAKVPALEVAETYDFAYEIDNPIEIDAFTEDVVFVLRKRKQSR